MPFDPFRPSKYRRGPASRSIVTVGADPTAVVAVAMTPSTVSVAPQGSTPITASPRNYLGQPIAGLSVSWQSSNTGVATVTPGTGYDATVTGVGGGSCVITATINGVIGSAPVAVSQPSGSFANLPASFSVLSEMDASSLTTPLRGLTWTNTNFASNGSNAILPNGDAGAPLSPPTLARTTYLSGMGVGLEPCAWTPGVMAQQSQLYLSLRLRHNINSGTGVFEMPPSTLKQGFLGYAESTGSALNEGYLRILASSGSAKTTQASGSSRPIEFVMQNDGTIGSEYGAFDSGVQDLSLDQNLDATQYHTFGFYHHWEVIWKINTLGLRDGGFDLWIDGHHVSHWTQVVYRNAGFPNAFLCWNWRPTWGGNVAGVTKSQQDTIDIDHILLAGIAA